MNRYILYMCYGSSGWVQDGSFTSVSQAVQHARAVLDAGVQCQIVDSDKYNNNICKSWTINGRSKS